MRTLTLLLLAISLPATASAEVRVVKRLSLQQRTTSPTFDPVDFPRVVDRGRMLYIGSGLWSEQETLYLIWLRGRRTIRRTVPLKSFLRQSGILAPHQRPAHKHFGLQRLLFYDRDNKAAAVEVADTAGKVRRHFYLHWDLNTRQIVEATLVARATAHRSYAALIPIGYQPDKRRFYYLRDLRGASGGQPRTVTVVAFLRGKPKVAAQFRARRPIHRKAYIDAARERALLLEYAERGSTGSAPIGHLVDLDSGTVRTLPVPLTAYGAAFDPTGRFVFVYSSQTGKLWQIELPVGKRPAKVTRKTSVGKLGHELGLLPDGRLLVLRNSGLQFVDTKRLRKRRFVPMKKIYRGFSHVQGSTVAGEHIVLKNGQLLYLLSL